MKAIALISGGLDSVLAAKLVGSLGVDIVPLNFRIPFCKKNLPARDDNLGLDVQCRDISEEFIKLLEKPEYGFGSNMNPCIDCKILMLSASRRLMDEFKASFVVTGEVLGQRPMSQNRRALEIIERKSGLENLVLRPLSARLLPETIPEKNGWVKRQDLMNFGGRTRKPQMELARRMNLTRFSQPAGGCLLTDPSYSRRLKDIIIHKELKLDNLELSKFGRHFRLNPSLKLVVGRNHQENRQIASLAKSSDRLFFPTKDVAGPVSLARGPIDEEAILLCASIAARYCDNGGSCVRIAHFQKMTRPVDQRLNFSDVAAACETDIARYRV